MTTNVCRVSFGGDKNVLKLIVVIDVQVCKCTEKDGIVHFK